MEIIHHDGILIKQHKEIPLSNFDDSDWRERLGRVVLVTGTYDLLTPHHFQFIRQCAQLESDLTCVLAVDSDEYVKRRKGPSRPIIPYVARRDILSEHEFVDWIIEHDGDNEKLIQLVRPNLFTMSYSTTQESPESRVSDIRAVESVGGRVVALYAGEGYALNNNGLRMSTSGIIRRVMELHTPTESVPAYTNGVALVQG